MPEGFSSIADLQVVVSARTAEATEGITQLRGVIEQFAGASGVGLGKFDTALLAVGNRVQWLKSTFGIWLQAAEMFMGVIGQTMAQAQQLANQNMPADKAEAFRSALAELSGTANSLLGSALESARTGFGLLGQEQGSAATATATLTAYLNGLADVAIRTVQETNTLVDSFRSVGDRSTATLETNLRAARLEAARLSGGFETLSGAANRVNQDLTQFTDLNQVQNAALREEIFLLETQLAMRRIIAGLPSNTGAPEADRDFDAIMANLNRELVALDQRARTMHMNSAAAEEFLGYERALDALRAARGDQSADFSEGQNEALARALAMRREYRDQIAQEEAERRRVEAARREQEQAAREAGRREQRFERDLDGGAREVLVIEARTRALYMEAGAAAEMAARENMLQKARMAGVEPTEEQRARIDALAAAIGAATTESERFKQQMTAVRDAGSAAARELEGAFKKWIEGTKLNVRDMVSSILKDLAMITFKQSITNPMQSLLTQSIGGLLKPSAGTKSDAGSSFGIADLVAGFRAAGGPVSGGRAYVVGENGPELFVPRVDGAILPDARDTHPGTLSADVLGGSRSGASPINMTFTIDARGATQDAIPAIRAEMAELKATMPSIIIQTMGDARDRGLA